MKSYEGYARKLYYVIPEDAKISYRKWVGRLEVLIVTSEARSGAGDTKRVVDTIVRCISRGCVTKEDYVQMVEHCRLLSSRDVLHFLEKDGRITLDILYTLIGFKFGDKS